MPVGAIKNFAPVRAVVALAVVAALALAGLSLAAFELIRGSELAGVVREAPASGAWVAATGFGTVAVERVQRLNGIAHAGHGGGSALSSDELLVRVRLENRLDRAIPYSPGQLRLRRDRSGTSISAIDPIDGRGVIEPGGSIRQEIAFLVPESSTRLSLLVDDLIGIETTPIALGEVPSP